MFFWIKYYGIIFIIIILSGHKKKKNVKGKIIIPGFSNDVKN